MKTVEIRVSIDNIGYEAIVLYNGKEIAMKSRDFSSGYARNKAPSVLLALFIETIEKFESWKYKEEMRKAKMRKAKKRDAEER